VAAVPFSTHSPFFAGHSQPNTKGFLTIGAQKRDSNPYEVAGCARERHFTGFRGINEMKKISLTALVTASFVATNAYASGPVDIPIVIVEPPAPESNWTGFYAGITLHTGTASFNFGPPSIDYNGAGLAAGYLHDMGSFVLGGELNWERNRISGTPVTTNRAGLDLIAGYDGGSIMPFVSVGVAQLSGFGGGSLEGVAAAIGVAVKVTENVIISGKIRATNYDLGGGFKMNARALVVGGAYQF
jgi:outer membrane immunogenic protein